MFAQRLDGVMSFQWSPEACRKNFKVPLQLSLVFDTWLIERIGKTGVAFN